MAEPLATSSGFDAGAVRADFPILSTTANGKPLCYLDNAASAQKPRAVIDAMAAVMESGYANVHRGLHYLSNKATDDFEAARRTVARFLNVADENEIIFTRGATEAINLVAQSWAMNTLKEGDEILLSVLEHHSNIVPWQMVAARTGAKLFWVGLHDDGSLDMEAFRAKLSDRTKLVAIGHMSNALGIIHPVREIVRLAHAAGAKVLVDGCQSVPHFPVDLKALGADFYVFSGHKIYGPTGVGALWAPMELLDQMPPWHGGGEMIGEVTEQGFTTASVPHKFEAGTPAIIEVIGLGAALDYVSRWDREAAVAHEMALHDRAMAEMKVMNSVRLYGTAEDKGAIISFGVEGAHPSDVATLLDHQGVAVRSGHHCAQPLMARLEVPATARASFAAYNTQDDVDRFLEALHKAVEMLS